MIPPVWRWVSPRSTSSERATSSAYRSWTCTLPSHPAHSPVVRASACCGSGADGTSSHEGNQVSAQDRLCSARTVCRPRWVRSPAERSEERRVGKECRFEWGAGAVYVMDATYGCAQKDNQ